jgi:hypothetical protein
VYVCVAIWEGNDRFLSRELLNGINQKSGGGVGVMSGLNTSSPAVDNSIARRRSFSKNTKFTLEKENELPHRTQTFLKNIGIGVETTNSPQRSSRMTHNEQKTKLVTHVFDCLGALEELVELDQQHSTASDLQALNETQSVCDRNTNSVGKLVHELVSIYGLCGDSLKVRCSLSLTLFFSHCCVFRCKVFAIVVSCCHAIYIYTNILLSASMMTVLHAHMLSLLLLLPLLQVLLESQPEAAAVEDAAGRMALHVAVDKHQPWIRLVNTLVDAYPTACKMRDGERGEMVREEDV